MPKLTKSAVDKLKPRAQRYDVTDDEVHGYVLRVLPDGRKVATIRYRVPGGRGFRRHKIGEIGPRPGHTAHEARELARDKLGDVRKGGDPSGDKRANSRAPTLADIADRFMREHARPYCKPRTADGYDDLLRLHVLPLLGQHKVASITQADVERTHQAIAAGKSKGKRKWSHKRPVTSATGAANRALHLLSTVLTKAEQWGERPRHSNPCGSVKRFPERKVERFLDAAERARLHTVFDTAERTPLGMPGYFAPSVVACVRLLSMTGARLAEITGLTWAMVDWQHRCLRLPDSKTGQKVIPLSRPAFDLLEHMHDEQPDDALVCPAANGGPLQNMQRSWAKIRTRAKLPSCRLHDLRHSAASDALMAGLPLAMVGALLGHKTPRTTQRYAHLDPSVLRVAAERMGEAIEQRTRDGAKVATLAEQREHAGLRIAGSAPKRSAKRRTKRDRKAAG